MKKKKKELSQNITDDFMRKRQAGILKHQAAKKAGKIFYAVAAIVLAAVLAVVLFYVFYRLDIVEIEPEETQPIIIEKPEEEFTTHSETQLVTVTEMRTY